MQKLMIRMYGNGVVEENGGPWGSLVVLAAKPHQENVPWHKYQWRLCVSYQKLNQLTRPFDFTIPRLDDAVHRINIKISFLLLWTFTVDIVK